MAVRDIVMIIPLCVLAGGRSTAAADLESGRVTVRVYDAVGLDANIRSAAFATASRAFAAAAVELSWTVCPRAGAMPPCDRPPTGELVVRIVRAAAAHPKSTVALGDALVDGSAHTATLATIYANTVTRLADAAEVPYGTVIGYAIAHELAHLLLASNAHSERGLMRALWRYEDLRSAQDENWTFSAADAAALRARVRGNAANIVWGTR
jgi:hypothetical protein